MATCGPPAGATACRVWSCEKQARQGKARRDKQGRWCDLCRVAVDMLFGLAWPHAGRPLGPRLVEFGAAKNRRDKERQGETSKGGGVIFVEWRSTCCLA